MLIVIDLSWVFDATTMVVYLAAYFTFLCAENLVYSAITNGRNTIGLETLYGQVVEQADSQHVTSGGTLKSFDRR